MNLLDLVPSLDRQLKQYRLSTHTESDLAGYLNDAIEALSYRWDRTYSIIFTAPKTYVVSPDITMRDKRPVILMAAIIYKMGNWSQAYVRDGDFAFDPRMINAQNNPLGLEIEELGLTLPPKRLASARTSPMRGFNNDFNRESYSYLWGILGI